MTKTSIDPALLVFRNFLISAWAFWLYLSLNQRCDMSFSSTLIFRPADSLCQLMNHRECSWARGILPGQKSSSLSDGSFESNSTINTSPYHQSLKGSSTIIEYLLPKYIPRTKRIWHFDPQAISVMAQVSSDQPLPACLIQARQSICLFHYACWTSSYSPNIVLEQGRLLDDDGISMERVSLWWVTSSLKCRMTLPNGLNSVKGLRNHSSMLTSRKVVITKVRL